jgi:hypothetical protein
LRRQIAAQRSERPVGGNAVRHAVERIEYDDASGPMMKMTDSTVMTPDQMARLKASRHR